MKFLEQIGAVYEQGDDCIYVEDNIVQEMGDRFPEFSGMMKPLSEQDVAGKYPGHSPKGYNSDVYVTVADGDAQQYSGTKKGIG